MSIEYDTHGCGGVTFFCEGGEYEFMPMTEGTLQVTSPSDDHSTEVMRLNRSEAAHLGAWLQEWGEIGNPATNETVMANRAAQRPTPTLRDQFAMSALTGIVPRIGPGHEAYAAELSYGIADAMLAHRSKVT